MLSYMPEKKLIFYTPGKIGAVFSLPAKKHITIKQLLMTQEYLAHETDNPVVYIEERRVKPRSQH